MRACAKSTSRPDLSKARTKRHHEAPGPSYALRERVVGRRRRRLKPNRDIHGDLEHTTFETVRGSSSRPALDFGRRAPKAAPGLARERPPSTGKPGLRRFGQGDAYSARCQTLIRGAPVHARETPPLAGLELGDNVAGNRRPQPPSLTS